MGPPDVTAEIGRSEDTALGEPCTQLDLALARIRVEIGVLSEEGAEGTANVVARFGSAW